jgi:hypothetical protein
MFKRLSMHPAARGRTEQFGGVVRAVLSLTMPYPRLAVKIKLLKFN